MGSGSSAFAESCKKNIKFIMIKTVLPTRKRFINEGQISLGAISGTANP